MASALRIPEKHPPTHIHELYLRVTARFMWVDLETGAGNSNALAVIPCLDLHDGNCAPRNDFGLNRRFGHSYTRKQRQETTNKPAGIHRSRTLKEVNVF
jgi:hypothetical protein